MPQCLKWHGVNMTSDDLSFDEIEKDRKAHEAKLLTYPNYVDHWFEGFKVKYKRSISLPHSVSYECGENCSGKWKDHYNINGFIFIFELEEDAVWFKMTWG